MKMGHQNLSKSFQEGVWEKREINGKNGPNWGTIYVYMEVSQRNTLYNYHILIKTFLKRLISWLGMYSFATVEALFMSLPTATSFTVC
jgi:hypothetical protein